MLYIRHQSYSKLCYISDIRVTVNYAISDIRVTVNCAISDIRVTVNCVISDMEMLLPCDESCHILIIKNNNIIYIL